MSARSYSDVNLDSDAEDELYSCYYCGDNFASPYLLHKHWVNHYNDGEDSDDDAVDSEEISMVYKFTGEDTSKAHVHYEHGTISGGDICKENLEPHIQRVISEKSSSTHGDKQCQYCSKMFRSNQGRERHVRSIHQGERHECGKYNKTFTQKTQSGIKPHKCKDCGTKFTVKASLDRHVKIVHRRERTHECSVCEKTFSMKQDLIRHSLTHGGVKPYECKHCGSTFIRKVSLEEHIMSVHIECKQTFTHKRNLNRHKLIHTEIKPQECEHSDKFTRDGNLCSYVKSIHQGERHECGECKKTFTQKTRLNRHKLIHRGIKPHQCKDCAAKFTVKASLDRHVKIVHRRERTHECSVCEKTFSMKQDLMRHSLTHGGVKPYECKHCGSTFIRKVSLEKHVSSVHKL